MKKGFAILGFVLALYAAPAFGQGCAMCYSTAAAASKDGQRAVNKAILVMLVPTLGFMTVGIGAARQYSKNRDKDKERLQD
ncbi:MAG: hypothetical protein WB755_06690 [Terriglobales bacterium]